MSKEQGKNPFLMILLSTMTIGACLLIYKQFEIQRIAYSITNKYSSLDDNILVSPYFPKAKENFSIMEYPFGYFSVNLARPSGPQRFLKVKMIFLVETPTNDKLKEIINNTPTLRNEIINIINTTEPKEVLKLEGRQVLKDLLEKHINQKMKNDKVRKILFTQFLVS